MDPQTYPLLEALSSRESIVLLTNLLELPGGVDDLANRAHLSDATASRRLTSMALVGLISREQVKGPYVVTCPEPTRQLLEAASKLASEILAARVESEQAFARDVARTRLRVAATSEGAPGSPGRPPKPSQAPS